MAVDGDGILGIDIGATSIKFARLDSQGNLGKTRAYPIDAHSNSAFIQQIIKIIADGEFENTNSVGIGSPGPLDIEQGIILSSANMPHLKGVKLVEELTKKFPQKKIRLDNDANCATLGQKFFGLAKRSETFSVFTLGTGVGGGFFWKGKLERGYKGNFFEVGHIPIGAMEANSRVCGCGSRGCLEAYASATGISASYREATGKNLSAKEIADSARLNDIHAQRAYNLAGKTLGLACATITQTLNSTEFIFTGGVAHAEDLLFPEIIKEYKAHTFPLFHSLVKIAFTRGDENSGILGAAALLLE
ncbi:MAG: N-acetyl-D-glucosamine kinase [Turneriella sp.]|nr:N-acetyl-D-glucosamine kinase [Turneriella sp.]